MKFYKLRDFLSISDIADYLTDKGMGNFDTNNSQDRYKLHNFLKELVLDKKLNIVFRYYGRVEFYDENFTKNPKPLSEKINLFCNDEVFVLLFDGKMLKDWLDNQDYYWHDFYQSDTHKSEFDFFTYRIFDDKEHPYLILLDDNNGQYGIEPLFPKSQLEQLFLEQKRDGLQSQIDSINNQLDEMSERTETSYLITIGLLLELLKTPKGFDKDNKPNKPLFDSNSQIIQNILDYGIRGQGESTLENRFAKANNALNETKKK